MSQTKNKVLITGANGQLGQEIVGVFSQNFLVIGQDSNELDITNLEQTRKVLRSEKPDWVVHSAAWTDVEGCAEDPDKAMLINGVGTKNIAEVAKSTGCKMVYISTNEVFDGRKGGIYHEDDKTNPMNPYAVSKLTGEKFVEKILGEDGIIVRTSWVYGPKGKTNFPLKILAAVKTNPELKVVDDEVATPTYAPDLAKWIFELIQKQPSGIYHLVNDGYCSRFDWAEQILRVKKINIKILRTKLNDYQRLSTPPAFSPLSNQKIKTLGIKPRPWQEASQEYLDTI